ncbi:MAG TPA: hypothetical protein ENK55_06250 [Actinobacteria bacterium]|nr:hypothetical protein [Actinomycetota bacterium]
MRTSDRSVLTELLPAEETAIEAVVARYQRVAPAVTRFARSMAADEELRVRLGTQATASPGEIVLDPGVFQAAYLRAAPVTPTEVALTSALHEVVHLLATDFDEERPIPREWLAHRRRDVADGEPVATPTARSAPESKPTDAEAAQTEESRPMPLLDALAEIGGPPAEALFLSLEDARQERRHFAAYPGAWSVLGDLYRVSMPEAMAKARPLGQFALAAFLLVGGYFDRESLERRLDAHVAAALDDATPFLTEVPNLDDPWAVGTVALQLLEVARLHGLLTETSTAGPAARKAALEHDRAAIAEGVDAVRLPTPPLRDRDAYDETRQAAHSVSAEEGRHGEAEQAGDPATEQIMRISVAPDVYLPTGQSGKLVVCGLPERYRRFAPEGHALLAEAVRHWGVAQHRVSGELYPLFLANQRRGLRSGFDAGDLSPYSALLLGAGLYERMFERRDLPTRRSYGVSLLVDGSASMLQPRAGSGPRRRPWALAAATLGAWTLARLCDELQIDFEVAIFNRSFPASPTDTERSYLERRSRATGALRRSQGSGAERLTRTVNHYLVKPFASRWRLAEELMAGLFYVAAAPGEAARAVRQDPAAAPPVSMFDKAANVDEFNLVHAAERLAQRRVSHRIIVVLADGMTRGSVEALAAAAHEVERSGTTVLGIGIGDDTVAAAYARNAIVERPDELAAAMVDGVRSTLLRTIARSGSDGWWRSASERRLVEGSHVA